MSWCRVLYNGGLSVTLAVQGVDSQSQAKWIGEPRMVDEAIQPTLLYQVVDVPKLPYLKNK